MRLADLNPEFLGDSTGRKGVGVQLDCPCLSDKCMRLYVPFDVALDGTPTGHGERGWKRTGDTVETLTLSPSIQRIRSHDTCDWHGFIENGGVRTA